jgi:hypothetical protein
MRLLCFSIVAILSLLSGARGSGVVMTLYLRSSKYEYQNCTGRIILEQIRKQGNCDTSKLPHKDECYGVGMKQTCVSGTDIARSMPNWISLDRGRLDQCADERKTPIEAEGFLTGCFKTYFNGTFICSSKMACISGRQEFTQYLSKDCTTEIMGTRLLGVETEFDTCVQTRKPYVWRTTHCETQEK